MAIDEALRRVRPIPRLRRRTTSSASAAATRGSSRSATCGRVVRLRARRDGRPALPAVRASAARPRARSWRSERREATTAEPILLGAHVSAAGGVPEAPPRAAAIDATAMQLFTKMANRWAERECVDDECVSFRERLARDGRDGDDGARLVPDQPREPRSRCCARGRSSRSRRELRRCEALGLALSRVASRATYMDERDAGHRAQRRRDQRGARRGAGRARCSASRRRRARAPRSARRSRSSRRSSSASIRRIARASASASTPATSTPPATTSCRTTTA